MPDWPMWVWILIVVVVLAIIVAAIVAANNSNRAADRARAQELREQAARDEHLLDARRTKAEVVAAQAETSRSAALIETERADALRAQADEADERAARAAEDAESINLEADRVQSDLEAARAEHDDLLREADLRDPDGADPEDRHRGSDVDGDGERDPEEGVRLRDGGRPLDDTRDAVVEDEAPVADDVPRDEQGRRLDPYGNPVEDDRF